MEIKVIEIGSSTSECRECGQAALPSEKVHTTVPIGWGSVPSVEKVGCGAEWTHYTNGHFGWDELIHAAWPHLLKVELPNPYAPPKES